MTFKIFRRGVMTFRNSREHCGRLDCACSTKRELAFELVSKILRARVDGSDVASFDGVVLGSFVAQVRGIRFSYFGVSGESVVIGHRPDNVHDVWHSRLSTSKHSNTPYLRHTNVVFIGQIKLVNNSFSNLALLQLFYKYTCIVVSSYLMDDGWQLHNSPLHLDCCTQGLILFARSNTKACQSYSVHTRAGTINRLIDYVVNADNRFVTVIINYHNRFSIDAIHYKRWNISR